MESWWFLTSRHLVDPPQYAAYHAFKLARNLLTKQPSLHESFVVAWRLVQENGSGAPGPVKELQTVARRMGWVWSDPWHFQRPSRRPLALFGGPDTWWLHEIRDGLRISQWKAAAARRQDMQGLDTDHGVDRLASMALMRQRKTTPRDKARLQSLAAFGCKRGCTQQRSWTHQFASFATELMRRFRISSMSAQPGKASAKSIQHLQRT